MQIMAFIDSGMKEILANIKHHFMRNFLAFRILFAKDIRLVVGSDITRYPGWIPSQKICLDMCKRSNFEYVFRRRKITCVLAEHVLEHIELENLTIALCNIFDYLEENGNFRIAVPDGYHRDNEYIELVKPGGLGVGSSDHKHLFNYQSLSRLLLECGFDVELREYWNQDGEFESTYQNSDGLGYIQRSFINDVRNNDGHPNYTSLIVDARKTV